ncbi:MAG: TetR/AcrR family transcriptional regulator [Burkholderiales bacterium]|jgi:AcrR family transcriptional regulator|nr:TetR/AcrR family transcriptional regulator [Burkholderiales bacterium]
MEHIPFKEQQFKARESAVIDAANRLMGQKGYDQMTMDDVAAELGISKGIIYKHFPSKESLAAAAMIRLLQETLAMLAALPPSLSARGKLEAALAWALRRRAEGGLPLLPANSAALQKALLANLGYVGQLLQLNAAVTALVEEARQDGSLRRDLPAEVMVHVIYARTCDPAFDFLKDTGRHPVDTLIEHLVASCFGGLAVPGSPP